MVFKINTTTELSVINQRKFGSSETSNTAFEVAILINGKVQGDVLTWQSEEQVEQLKNNLRTMLGEAELVTKQDVIWWKEIGQDRWNILTNEEGDTFTCIDAAILFIRTNADKFPHTGLATFEQMELDNAMWDNL